MLLLACVVACLALPGLKVVGNTIYDDNGNVVVLHGVSRSGTEFMCVQGHGFIDGPSSPDSIAVFRGWHTNIVRVPMNEDCWLGINGVEPKFAGSNYQQFLVNWVNTLNANGMYVIMDLHWAAPGSQLATKQLPMPDMDHSLQFWKEVANIFKNNTAVIFELFNEPFPFNGRWSGADVWACIQNGTLCKEAYACAGYQQLVDAVRSTGARNIIATGGPAWSNSLDMWLQYMPRDPLQSIAAIWHSYSFNYCSKVDCWNQYVAPVAQRVPLIVSELGENDCTPNYINQLLPWADAHHLHYLGWTWNTWDCSNGPSLISNYDGTPTNYGQGYKAHLASINGAQ